MKHFNPKWIKVVAAALAILILVAFWFFRGNPATAPSGTQVPGNLTDASITSVVDRGMTPEQEQTLAEKIAVAEKVVVDNEAAGTRDISKILPLANLYYQAGELETAAKWYNDILRTNPNDPPALENLAQAQIEMGAWNGAKASLERVADLEPYEPTYLKLVDLIAAHFPEQNARIQTILESAIGNLGQTPGLLTALGDWYAANGKLDEAISHYEVARVLAPKDTTIVEKIAELKVERAAAKSAEK